MIAESPATAAECAEGALCVVTYLPVTTGGQPSAASCDTAGATLCARIVVGAGYTDVSPKQLVRTSEDRLYVFASNCESYPCVAASQTLRAYRADSTGLPGALSRMSAAHEPSGVAQWAVAIDGNDLIHVVYTHRTANQEAITALRYVTFNPATGTWDTPVDHYPNTIDIAYWDDTYPNTLHVLTAIAGASDSPAPPASKECAGEHRPPSLSRCCHGAWRRPPLATTATILTLI
ncbi:MAG TPA: hypothetical protein VNL77_00270 [Roseiflexaceae bacterium]|nr:hypothetical protein [Roseiflexaceae bacterium]